MIILLNWHDEQQTLQFVRTLRTWQDLRPDILVIDNQATPESRDALCHELTTDEYLSNAINLGYAGGNNLGIRQALRQRIDYILLLNTDAEISEASVIRLLERLDATPDISILGPVIFEGEPSTMRCFIGGRDIARYALTRIGVEPDTLTAIASYPLHHVEYVSGTVFLTRRAVFEEIGLLDERYFFSGEIADFCQRARGKGHKACVDLDVYAYHYTDKTAVERRRTLYVYYSLRNRFLYIQKHHASEKWRYFGYWLHTGGQQLAGAVLRRDPAQARAVLIALTHALRNQFGDQNETFKY